MRWILNLCVIVGFVATMAACDGPQMTAPSDSVPEGIGTLANPGEDAPSGDAPDINLRLAGPIREAVKLECFYALSQPHTGFSGKNLSGNAVSDWNYLNNDTNAYAKMKEKYQGNSSLHPDFNDPLRYGFKDYSPNYPVGRGGQCRYFSDLILFRSGIGKGLPSYQTAINDYYGGRRFTKIAGQARVGDILQTKWQNGHTAVVVGIISGQEGVWASAIDVIDSNYVGNANNEVIGRHVLSVGGSGTSNLDNYLAIDLDRL